MTFHRAHPTPNPLLNARPLPPGLRARLRREHGWSDAFAAGAEDEYRRFVYLASSGQAVTPSPTVDEVWHTHLMFTRDYWGGFQAALNAPLHHEPGTGAPGDAAHFQAQYLGTLALYARTFGEAPPAAYWPRPQDQRPHPQPPRPLSARGRDTGGWAAALAIVGGAALVLGVRAVVILATLALGLLGVALVRALYRTLGRSRPGGRRSHDSGDSGGLLAVFGLELGGSGSDGCPGDSGGHGGGSDGGGCGSGGSDGGGSGCGSGCGGGGCGS